MDSATPTADLISAIWQAGQRALESAAKTEEFGVQARQGGTNQDAPISISRLPVPWQEAA